MPTRLRIAMTLAGRIKVVFELGSGFWSEYRDKIKWGEILAWDLDVSLDFNSANFD